MLPGVTSTSETALLDDVIGTASGSAGLLKELREELRYPHPLLLIRGTSFSCLFRTDLGLSSSGIPAVLGRVDTLFPVVRLMDNALAELSGLGESTAAPPSIYSLFQDTGCGKFHSPFSSEGGTAPFLTGVSLSNSSGEMHWPKLTLFLLSEVPSAQSSAILLLTGSSGMGVFTYEVRIFSPSTSGLFSCTFPLSIVFLTWKGEASGNSHLKKWSLIVNTSLCLNKNSDKNPK